MVSLVFVIAYVIMPASLLILVLLLLPIAPQFLLKRFSKYLWDLSLPLGKQRFKLVHLMLIISGFLCIAKANEYYELLRESSENPHFELAVDMKMKFNRCARDFYIMGNFFAVWFYIWRVIPLVSKLVN